MAGRQTAAALTAIARTRQWPCVFLSLNDPRERKEASVGELRFRFTGFARQKARFCFEAFRIARKNPKVIFAAHPYLAPVAAMMKTVAKDAKSIVGAHGVEVWRPLPAVRRATLRRADMVTAPSSDTVRRLAVIQGVPERKIRRLPWPLDPEFSRRAQCPQSLGRPEGFPCGQVVLSVGRWAAKERYKGADLLIEATAELSRDFPELHLVLVGDGDDLGRLRRLAHDSLAREHVHFFTGLSRQALVDCYSSADVFALPSTGEGFGLVFLEAMALGKPVIGTNEGGIPDLVQNGREGLLVEPTATAVSAAVRRLLMDSGLREELGAQGKQRVNSEFTFEGFERQLETLLDEACSKASQQSTERAGS